MTSKTRKTKAPAPVSNEEVSLVQEELNRLQRQVNDILASMESINLLSIEDTEERMKATNTKLTISLKLPQLISALDDLKNKAKLKTEQIKGSKEISLLESGALK